MIGLSFDYGQRHRRELAAAATVAGDLALEEHHVIAVNLAAWGGSALMDWVEASKMTRCLPLFSRMPCGVQRR